MFIHATYSTYKRTQTITEVPQTKKGLVAILESIAEAQ